LAFRGISELVFIPEDRSKNHQFFALVNLKPGFKHNKYFHTVEMDIAGRILELHLPKQDLEFVEALASHDL
jgi:hypothetical protein